ncbi:c-type cytochrome [Stutzerimonas tarimensis]|uniref:C-type cytochrome n=1 Tax=Stutzerimonas tarimensis TaxID=1507735 RepID=A0ABV7T3S4_9GAMM
MLKMTTRRMVGAAVGMSLMTGGQAGDALERHGEYLSRAGNCMGCHTRPGGEPFAGGVRFVTPFGILYSTNITPDSSTGLGDWSDEDFLRAMHEGVRPDGEHLYPAFPYTAYTLLSREDVLAIKAYLDTQPAVDYRPPPNQGRLPFGNRTLMGPWKWLNLEQRRFDPTAYDDPQVARGAYLSEALGHCGECHTPRTWSQGLDRDRHYAGAVQGGWAAWNITPGPRGIGNWSQDKLINYLRNGHQRGEAVAAGPMAAVVSSSLRHLSDGDLAAMAAYLMNMPARPGQVPAREEIQPGEPGSRDAGAELLLISACESCHLPNGRGVAGPYPSSFPNYSAVRDPSGRNLIKVLLHGLERQGQDRDFFMPAYRDLLTDTQIAALATLIARRYGGHEGAFDAAEVARLRQEAPE